MSGFIQTDRNLRGFDIKHICYIYYRSFFGVLLFIIPVFVLSSCSCGKKEKDLAEEQDTALAPFALTDTIISKKDFPLVLSDSNWTRNYSIDFFKGYKNSKYKRIQLSDQLIVLDQSDSAAFPDIPDIGKKFKLKATYRETTIHLDFIRKNYTTIHYNLEFHHPRKKKLQFAGIAHLHPDFFLRIDSDRSTTSGATYDIIEFTDNTQKKCPTDIRVGYEEISGSGMQVKIFKKCNGSFGDINADNFPTLIEYK